MTQRYRGWPGSGEDGGRYVRLGHTGPQGAGTGAASAWRSGPRGGGDGEHGRCPRGALPYGAAALNAGLRGRAAWSQAASTQEGQRANVYRHYSTSDSKFVIFFSDLATFLKVGLSPIYQMRKLRLGKLAKLVLIHTTSKQKGQHSISTPKV